MQSGAVVFGLFALVLIVMAAEAVLARRRRRRKAAPWRSGSPPPPRMAQAARPAAPAQAPARPRGENGRENYARELENLLRKEAEIREWSRARAYKPPDAQDAAADDGQDDYAAFVEEIWGLPGIPLPPLAFQRVRSTGERSECVLASLAKAPNGTTYINAYEAGLRRTFRADRRHHWTHDGHAVDESAFMAVARGVAPEIAFARDSPPSSISEALEPRNNRFGGKGAQFVIGYRNESGEASFRVISNVIRSDDRLSARCHYRWGERRTFLFDRISAVADARTGEIIPREVFFARRSTSRPRA